MNEEYYINLIYKSLDNVLSPTELEELELWRKASDDNDRTYLSIELAWKHTEIPSVEVPEVDLDMEFAELEDKIAEEEEDARVIKLKRQSSAKSRVNWLAIAAGILLIIGAGFIFRLLTTDGVTQGWVEVKTTTLTKTVQLTDGSKVTINKYSSLSYPEEFEEDKRSIQLDGEAFFEVARDENKPFVIETVNERVNVRSYSKSGESAVYVKTGKVRFETLDASEGVILTKGDQAVLDKQSNKIEKNDDADPNIISWIRGELIYRDVPFADVIEDLRNYYNIDIQLSNSTIGKCPYTSIIKGNNVETIIETISIALGVEVTKSSGGVYILSGGSCD
jgi:ferric-dicitrate binding protein FerR (iron transport regulator)